jgi:chaperone modulatory protein CbpM
MTAMTDIWEAARALEGVSVEELHLWIGAGWVLPDRSAAEPVLDPVDLARARFIHALMSELAIEAETVPVVLALVDQIHGLRRELKRLAGAVSRQPEPIRQAIVQSCRDQRGGEAESPR